MLRRFAISLPVAALAVAAIGCGTVKSSGAATASPPLALVPEGFLPAPIPTARPVGAEPVIAQTTIPAITNLALRFQPTVEMSMFDRFWPVSVAAVLDEGNNGRHTCLVVPGSVCGATPPTLADLRPAASSDSYLEFPEPLDNVEAQFAGLESGLGATQTTISRWRENPLTLDPYASAQIYFYYAGKAPYPYPGVPPGLISLQYWFFYPLNYYPTVVNPLEILRNPLGGIYANSDYHEGDWEHATVLIDTSGTPRFLWMARHSKEGVAIPWDQVSVDNGHPIIYPALGGHPSYASCGRHPRALFHGLLSDYVACAAGVFTFTYATTPLVDLSEVSWRCWPGHFGVAGPGLHTANNFDDPTGLFLVAGPPSPLRQAENANVCRPPP